MKSLSTSTKVQIRVIYLYFRPYPHYMCFVFKHTNMMMFSIKDPGGHFQICHFFQTCSNCSRTVVQILVGSKKEQICEISFCQNELIFLKIMSTSMFHCFLVCYQMFSSSNQWKLSHSLLLLPLPPATSNHFVLFVFHACVKGDIFTNSRK